MPSLLTQLTPDAKGVYDILKAYDLDPAFVLIRDPQFFNQSRKYPLSVKFVWPSYCGNGERDDSRSWCPYS